MVPVDIWDAAACHGAAAQAAKAQRARQRLRILHKACIVADSMGLAIVLRHALCQAQEFHHVEPLPDRLPGAPMWIVANLSYSSSAFRQHVRGFLTRPTVPISRDEAPTTYPKPIPNDRERPRAALTGTEGAFRCSDPLREDGRAVPQPLLPAAFVPGANEP